MNGRRCRAQAALVLRADGCGLFGLAGTRRFWNGIRSVSLITTARTADGTDPRPHAVIVAPRTIAPGSITIAPDPMRYVRPFPASAWRPTVSMRVNQPGKRRALAHTRRPPAGAAARSPLIYICRSVHGALTDRQAEILRLGASSPKCRAIADPRGKIAERMGFRSVNAPNSTCARWRKGAIENPSGARAAPRVRDARRKPGRPMLELPVIGRVAAGAPMLAEEHVQGRTR